MSWILDKAKLRGMLPTCVGSVMWILENKLISVLYLYIFNYEDPVLGQIFSSLIGHRYLLEWEEDLKKQIRLDTSEVRMPSTLI